jgi:putative oxidoreductase
MTDSRTAPYASLLLRLALGILFLAHFSLKFFVFTPAGTAKFLPLSVCLAGWPISPWRLNWWGRLR